MLVELGVVEATSLVAPVLLVELLVAPIVLEV
jgi:hypothetical protein